MLNNKILSSLAPAVTFTVLALGVWMWLLKPELAFLSVISAGFLPAVWLGMAAIKRTKAGANFIRKAAQELRSGITAAGFLLGLALALTIAQVFDVTDASMSDRINSAIIGLIMVIIGNSLPKTLESTDQQKCTYSTEQKLKRFAGWTFVIAGLGYSLIWMFAPIAIAGELAMYVMGLGVALIAMKFVWIRISK